MTFVAWASKTVLQMAIAVVTVAVVGWHLLHTWPGSPGEMTRLLLDGVGVGLAAAAVVELAYTLFTPGPDEALDPLMLGISAAMLIEAGKSDPFTVSRGLSIAWCYQPPPDGPEAVRPEATGPARA